MAGDSGAAPSGGPLLEIRTTTLRSRPLATITFSSVAGACGHAAAAAFGRGSLGGTWPLKSTSPLMDPGPVLGGAATDASIEGPPSGPRFLSGHPRLVTSVTASNGQNRNRNVGRLPTLWRLVTEGLG